MAYKFPKLHEDDFPAVTEPNLSMAQVDLRSNTGTVTKMAISENDVPLD